MSVAKILMVAAVVLSVLPVGVVAISADPGGRLVTARIGEGIEIDLSYVHSVEMTRVYELYRIDNKGIQLHQMRWQSTGAGLPDSYDSWENGYYMKEQRVNLGRQLDYWFIPASDPEICLNDRVVVCGLEHPARIEMCSRTVPLVVYLLRIVAS